MNGDETTAERGAVLDAAEELIREKGADGWALAELARRSGIGERELEAEFGSEWEVFSQVIHRDERRFEEGILEEPPDSPGQKVLAVLEACVPDYDWTYWIELWSLALRDERARELRAELDRRFRDMLEEMVREGVEAGEFHVTDTRATAVTIATLIDALALQATLGDTTIRPNFMLDACVTVCGTLLGAPLELPPLQETRDV